MTVPDDPDAARRHDDADGGHRREDDVGHPPVDGVPLDQQPVDLQPTLPPVTGDGPRLPDRQDVGSTIPTLPASIPPLHTTTPEDVVASATPDQWDTGRFGVSALDDVVVPSGTPFEPLRSDSPPRLAETRWIRWTLFVSMVLALAVTSTDAYVGDDDPRVTAPLVALHVAAILLLAFWSARTMRNAAAVAPPTRYQRAPRPVPAVLSIVIGAGVPVAVFVLARSWQERADDPGDLLYAVWAAAAVVGLVAVWMPVRLHVRQAARIGAPTRPIVSCVLLPGGAVLAGVVVLAIGLREDLLAGGLTGVDRLVWLTAWYGAPMVLATLTVWRATTVFDEVIELRWHRWQRDWDRTIEAMSALPPPGPEGSPDLDLLDGPHRRP